MLSALRKFLGASILTSLFFLAPSNTVMACGDYCDYGALYTTGGYGLLDFGFQMYDVGTSYYSSPTYYNSSNWGGSCGSLVVDCSCDSSYTLSGNSNQVSLLDIQLINLINQQNQQLYPTIPTNPIDSTWPGTPGIPGVPGIPGIPGVPGTPGIPPTTWLPPSLPPTLPPYGGCDGIIIPCPQPPVGPNPPTYFPPGNPGTPMNPGTPWTPTNPTTPTIPGIPTTPTTPTIPTTPTVPPIITNPTHTPVSGPQNLPPDRYRVPRGVR